MVVEVLPVVSDRVIMIIGHGVLFMMIIVVVLVVIVVLVVFVDCRLGGVYGRTKLWWRPL